MTTSEIPPGHLREQALVERLDEIRSLIDELRDELPNVNNADLQPLVLSVVETGSNVLDFHGLEPRPTIADDLTAILAAVRELSVPRRDAELGVTPTLERVRKSKGLIIAGLVDALDAAEAIGLRPHQQPFPQEAVGEVARTDVQGVLGGIARRLAQVEASLNQLDDAKQAPTEFDQQAKLLDIFIGAMRIEIDIARLQLTVGERAVNFSALSRAVETMVRLTVDFLATVNAWKGRVSDSVSRGAEELRVRVRRAVAGVRSAIKWVHRKRSRATRIASQDALASTHEPTETEGGSIGARLRQERLRFGRSLEQIGLALRIRQTFLKAIEEGKYELLPGSTYAIGWVRTYAEFLGIDGELAVASYKREAAQKVPLNARWWWRGGR
jgi:hypothetical protein